MLGVHARVAVAVAIAIAAGCDSKSAYHCTGSDQCVSGGQNGTCEPSGFCSFPDPGCPSGSKYEPNAGDGLGGTCVVVDAPPAACGAVGQACCGTGDSATCVPNASCTGGSCEACTKQIALGRRFMCLIERDNTVWCSGDNAQGQLGLGVASNTPSPVLMQVRDSNAELVSDATAIGAGREHACVVRAGGTVWCWGLNVDGELGNNVPYPMPPAQLPSSPFAVQVLKSDGTPLTGMTTVQASSAHTCALDEAGGAWCWGANNHYQLADGTQTPRSSAAPALTAMAGPPLSGATELQISGNGTSCFRMGPDIWCWGDNGSGQLGDTTTANRPFPSKAATTTSFALGAWHACWVNPDATVSCAGWGGHGRLGDGTGPSYEEGNVPTPVTVLQSVGGPPLTGIAKVAAGAFSCAITLDQHAYCWGDDAYGQTGTGTGSTVPVQLVKHDGTPLAGIVSITARFTHGCAYLVDGSVWCWGRNLEGELGDGTFLNHGTPTGFGGGCR